MQIVFLDSNTIPSVLPVPAWTNKWINLPATESGTQQVVQALLDADICITNKVKITAEILEQLPKLRLVCVAATGYDCIDIAACRARGVLVCNVPGYSRQSVAEGVIGMIFNLRRGLQFYQGVGRQTWSDSKIFCVHGQGILNIADATLGIFGRGAIGSEVARLAQALGMNVLFGEHRDQVNPRPGYVSFKDLLRQSDVITLHCPLTNNTRGMIGEPEIALMKPGTLLVNTARGPLVDENALLKGLENGHLGGAALDVLAVEPPPAHHALIKCTHPNLIITPHITWASEAGVGNLVQGILSNLEAFVAGTPINVVN